MVGPSPARASPCSPPWPPGCGTRTRARSCSTGSTAGGAQHDPSCARLVGCAFERPVAGRPRRSPEVDLVGRSLHRRAGSAASSHAGPLTRTSSSAGCRDGYDTPLSRSADVRWRGAAARPGPGLARPSRLLVLDDATSSLDMVTEMQIGRYPDRPTGGQRTRLIVTHRRRPRRRAPTWSSGSRPGRLRAASAPHERLWCRPGLPGGVRRVVMKREVRFGVAALRRRPVSRLLLWSVPEILADSDLRRGGRQCRRTPASSPGPPLIGLAWLGGLLLAAGRRRGRVAPGVPAPGRAGRAVPRRRSCAGWWPARCTRCRRPADDGALARLDAPGRDRPGHLRRADRGDPQLRRHRARRADRAAVARRRSIVALIAAAVPARLRGRS